MGWAAKRKLTYFSIFFVLAILLIGVPIALAFHHTPTCFDGKQNEQEDGVDCGGPCVKLCNPLELEPITKWQQTFTVLPGEYTAVAYIENPNLKAEAFSVPYLFTIYDSQNTIIATTSGTTDIPAAQNFAVVYPNIQIASGTPARTDFELGDNFTWQTTPTHPDLTIQNISISNASSPSVSADIANTSYTDLGRIDVVAIVYDASDNAFQASKTYLDGIAAQSSGHVVFTWPTAFTKTPVRAEIIPVINDRTNN